MIYVEQHQANMADVHEAAKKILNGEEFSLRLQELVTETVAQVVNRVKEATKARRTLLEGELSAAKAKLAEVEPHRQTRCLQSLYQPCHQRCTREARRSNRQPGARCRTGAAGRQSGQLPPSGPAPVGKIAAHRCEVRNT